jgi:hypothetical protein
VVTSVAHQRRIADELSGADPRDRPSSLVGYTVGLITRDQAEPIILKYEWLGTMGKARHIVGLLSPDREIQGVACFGPGPGGDINLDIGWSVMCLERGACVHYAPPNAPSFLINGACKLVYDLTGTAIFFAYGDPSAGEYGGVYQASGWVYLGQGLMGGKDRPFRVMVLPPGGDENRPQDWKTTRRLRQNGHLSYRTPIGGGLSEAELAGYKISKRPGKHVYATNVGPYRRAWRKAIVHKPYPAPRPELKIATRQGVQPNPMGKSGSIPGGRSTCFVT